MATYETNVNNHNNNNVYEEDNSSELSTKENTSSSASSFVIDETKKISFEDNKEEKNLSSSKRNKRNSFISRLNPKKDDKEKEEKEKHSEGLVRSLSGIFSGKDKDNNKREGEKQQLRPTSRTSSNSDTSKNRRSFVFFSDDDDKPEIDTTTKKGRKSRQTSNAEGLEKDKSSKKGKRISVNLGKLFKGFDENKSSQRSKDDWDNVFLAPDGTKIAPEENNNNNNNNYNNNDNNNNNNNNYNYGDYVDSPTPLSSSKNFTRSHPFPPKSRDDVQSTSSSTQPSSVDDDHGSPTSPTTPVTPKVIVTPTDAEITNKSNDQNQVENVLREEHDEKEGQINAINSVVGSKTRPPAISTTFTNSIGQQQGYDNNNNKTLQELEDINKSLNNVKEQLEAKVAEQNSQITKFDHSMEQIMQQQIDLSKRMSETMQRLESKANNNVQKEEPDHSSITKMFEDTVKRLESKIDKQNDELIRLKSVVGQLGQLNGENQPFLVGDISRLRITQGEDQNLILARQGEGRALVQANHSQSPQIYSKHTLVSTLVVNPLCNTITVSASIATSVLYAVYVRPVVGLVGVLRNTVSKNYETTD